MMISIKRQTPGTGVWQGPILPEEMAAPFEHGYGCLNAGETLPESCEPVEEIWHIVSGEGTVTLDGVSREVRAGDVAGIPASSRRTLAQRGAEPLVWGRYWWKPVQPGFTAQGGVPVKRFCAGTAYHDHDGTILADKVCPPGMAAPFWHQYGYLEPGKAMAGHTHPTQECYVVTEGEGFVTVGEERTAVRAGDVVEIPVNTFHTMSTGEGSSMTWFALWWD